MSDADRPSPPHEGAPKGAAHKAAKRPKAKKEDTKEDKVATTGGRLGRATPTLPPELIQPPAPREPGPLRVREIREVAILAMLWSAAVLALLGVLTVAILPDEYSQLGRAAEAVGLVVAVGAVIASWNVGTLRHLRAGVTGGAAYDRMRGEGGLRLASSLLQMLEIFAFIVVAIRVGSALGLVEIEIRPTVVDNGLRALLAALALACAAALSRSLRTPTDHHRTPTETALAMVGLIAAVPLALLALLTALDRTGPLDAWVSLQPADTVAIALAGYMVLAFALVRLRTLPTLTRLLSQDFEDRSRNLAARRAGVVLVPAILAFALLLVVFLLFLTFGIGVGDILTNAGRSPLLVGVLAFLLIAILASLGIALGLSRVGEKEPALYKELPDAERRRVQVIIGSSIVVAALFFVLAGLAYGGVLGGIGWIHYLCLGLLVGLGPYGFYSAREHRRIRRLEERFPDFLRDIASSHKGGLTLHQAASIAARGEYGDLTPEVRKMADQLSWNVSFGEALDRFAERVQTPLVQRAVSLILQADRSGGATTDVLLAAARDAREIKNLENERRITMGLYTVVVYITFFVFLGVAAVLYGQFAPQIVAASQATQGAALGQSAAASDLTSAGALSLRQYQLFYFLAAVMQGMGDGIVAGLLGSGSAALGLRHAFLMVLASYITFAFLL